MSTTAKKIRLDLRLSRSLHFFPTRSAFPKLSLLFLTREKKLLSRDEMAVHQPDLVMCRKQPGIGENEKKTKQADGEGGTSRVNRRRLSPIHFFSTSTLEILTSTLFLHPHPPPSPFQTKQPSAASAKNVRSIAGYKKERKRDTESCCHIIFICLYLLTITSRISGYYTLRVYSFDSKEANPSLIALRKPFKFQTFF